MGEACIPTADLSPFVREDEDGKKKAMEAITQACSEYGFFQIVNHGVSLDLIKEAMQPSKTFFDYSDEEKSKSSPSTNAPLPAGYSKQPLHSPDKNEFQLSLKTLPSSDGLLLESIINECLGLPTNFLKEFNHDRSWDFLLALRYFPASNNDNNGITEHEDSNILTFVIQDGVGGLQVLRNVEWIPAVPRGHYCGQWKRCYPGNSVFKCTKI
ncbi:Gibberellin 2-beta-dioxygenase 8 [Glycine soja]|uniref:Gibberellin 2-beta-dioxygenase 8 n=1 Tax=Glycine soja TaxID=3848 RepID=A0A0B2RGA2_GLYSO|nr:Gibberellin 2-beta-dioxygenase 8 [Glycine soja]